MNASAVGRLVAARRHEAGLTQAELAERIGTTQAAVSKIETGRTLPGLELLERVADATGAPISLTLGTEARAPSRRELRDRVRRVLGDYEFDPWVRDPTPAEAESLLADGLTRERFAHDRVRIGVSTKAEGPASPSVRRVGAGRRRPGRAR